MKWVECEYQENIIKKEPNLNMSKWDFKTIFTKFLAYLLVSPQRVC